MTREATPRLGRWHEGQTARPTPPRTRAWKWSTIGILGAVLLTLAIIAWRLLLGIYFPTGPRPYFASFWIGKFQKPELATIPWMEVDRNALRRDKTFAKVAPSDDLNPTLEMMRTGLNALQQRSPAESLIVYLAASAMVDDEGTVQVLAADSDPDNGPTLLPLSEVLEDLKGCPEPRKLLVLDVVRTPDLSGLRGEVDDVAERVREEVRKANDGRLLVLCACSSGEFSLGSEDLHGSVFNHFFRLGIRGAAETNRDRKIYVKELANYLGREVDSWARRTRGVHQRPFLIGSGSDFAIAVVKGPTPAQPGPQAKPAYPKWLADGWAKREGWWKANDFLAAPRVSRTLEADLLKAEHDWRGGVDPGQVQRTLEDRLRLWQDQIDRAKDLPRPGRYSVGLARAIGWEVDPDLVASLKEVRKKREPEPFATPEQTAATLKAAVTAFLDKLKGKTSLDLAGALVEATVEARFDVETIQFLDSLVVDSKKPIDMVETRFLRQLAERAKIASPGDWSADDVKTAWGVLCLAEKAHYQPHALPWVRSLLDEADARRLTGQVLLLPQASGYSSWGRIKDHWGKALEAYSFIDNAQGKIRNAQLVFYRAMAVLPASIAYLEQSGDLEHEALWLNTIEAARQVHETLRASRDATDGREGLPAEELDRLGNELKAVTDRLGDLLDDLLRPFQPEVLHQLTRLSESDRPDPRLAVKIDAVLATPFPAVQEREKLWLAGLGLARKLAAQPARPNDASPDPETDADRFSTLRNRAVRRAQRAIALLSLTGRDTTDLKEKQEVLATSGSSDPSKDLTSLAQIVGTVRERLCDPSKRLGPEEEDDLTGWVAPVSTLDLRSNPVRRRREREALAASGWLKGHYRHEGHDLGDPDKFYETAAFNCPGEVPPEVYLARIESLETVIDPRADHPTADVTLRFLLNDPAPGQAQELEVPLAALVSDERLRITTPPVLRLKPQDPTPVIVRAEWNEGEDRGGGRPPSGFILTAKLLNKRVFHTLVPLTIAPENERPRLVLVNDQVPPGEVPFDLRLRPIPGRQPYYLHVKNPSGSPRDVLVEVLSGDAVVPGGAAKLTAKARSTDKVTTFGAPVLKPNDPLPPLSGPLLVRLKDAVTGRVIDEQRLRVEIAGPLEYIRVTQAQFVPERPAQPNRLNVTLRALPRMTGPPCPVELVLSEKTIPGLTAAPKVYQLSTELEPGGEEQTLFAEGLALDPAVREDGRFALNVDGRKRALWYRIILAQQGEPQWARVDKEPRVRFEARPVLEPGRPARLRVDFAVDNDPADARLEWRLRLERMPGVAALPLWSDRAKDRHVGFDARGDGGALLFEASVEDWSREFETPQIRGDCRLEARLLDDKGKVLNVYELAMVLDDLPPQGIALGPLPVQVPKGTKSLAVTASATPPASGFKEVVFFVGKPADFEKAQAGALVTRAHPLGDDQKAWEATLPLPPNAVGPVVVSVRFVSGVGLAAFGSAELEVMEPKPDVQKKADDAEAKAPPAPGAIQGRVTQGDLPQPGRTVILYISSPVGPSSPTGLKEIKRTQSGRDGTFAFKDLNPGPYKVYSFNDASQTKATVDVVVEPGKTARVNPDLLR